MHRIETIRELALHTPHQPRRHPCRCRRANTIESLDGLVLHVLMQL